MRVVFCCSLNRSQTNRLLFSWVVVQLDSPETYLIIEGVCKLMRIYELIDNQTRKALRVVQHQGQPKKGKSSERLSERELKELMGVNRDQYRRVNGKVKRK